MTAFKNRPVAVFFAVFILSSVLLVNIDAKYKPIIIAVAFATAIMYALMFVILRKRNGRIKTISAFLILTAIAVVISALNVYFNVDKQIITSKELVGTSAEIKAEITDVKSETVYSGAYVADIFAVNGDETYIRIRLETEFSADLSVGDIISAAVTFDELTDEGAYDLKTNGFAKGVTGLAVAEDADTLKIEDQKKSVLYEIDALRERIGAVLAVSAELSGGDCGLMQALLVGDRSSLDGTVRRDFSYIGVSHLLAVSGMHLSIIIGGLELLLKKLRMHKTPQTVIIICAAFAYMGLAGFSMSVLRAGLMLILYRVAYLFGREPDRITSLFLSVGGIILVFPFAAADVGLLLSFAAMLACIAASDSAFPKPNAILSKIKEKGRIFGIFASALGFVCYSFAVSLYALIFTMPVMWIYFGRISLLAPVATVILSIPITAIMYLIPFALVSFRLPAIWALYQYPTSLLCRLTAKFAAFLAKIDGAELLLPTSDAVTAILSVALIICITLVLLLPKRGARRAGTAAVAIFIATAAISVGYSLNYDANSVRFLNSGTNDGFVLADGASALVIDISNGGSYVPLSLVEIANEELRADVDAFMLTHLHRRHINTVKKLFSSEYIEKLILPTPQSDDETEIYASLASIAEEYNAEVVTYDYGSEVEYGDILIDTAEAYIDRSVHPTLVLSIESEGERTTYIGSSVHESEIFTLALDICQCSDTVIFGSHGPIVKSGANYFITETQAAVYANDEIRFFFEEAVNKSDT